MEEEKKEDELEEDMMVAPSLLETVLVVPLSRELVPLSCHHHNEENDGNCKELIPSTKQGRIRLMMGKWQQNL